MFLLYMIKCKRVVLLNVYNWIMNRKAENQVNINNILDFSQKLKVFCFNCRKVHNNKEFRCVRECRGGNNA